MPPPAESDDLNVLLAHAADILRKARRVAVLTGAGVSAESGVATFRGAGGLWEGQRVEDVATPWAFERDPTLVWRFYNARRKGLQAIKPNPGHHALVDLENRCLGSDNFTLITQNVDGLHRAAGSRNVLEIHGTLSRVRCSGCDKVEDRPNEDLPDLPRCGCGALLRPDVVWFGEQLPHDIWVQAERAAAGCDCFLVVGTSAVVYPAAGLIHYAQQGGAGVLEVNIQPTEACAGAIGLYGPSGVILPQLVGLVGRL
jgi:NAD-dependent deacetylase